METLDLHTQWMSVMQTRSTGSLYGIETMGQRPCSLLHQDVVSLLTYLMSLMLRCTLWVFLQPR